MEERALLIADADLADRTTRCLRRGCAARALHVEFGRDVGPFFNGPSTSCDCTAVRGSCGCAHAEQRLVTTMLKEHLVRRDWKLYCTLSPCAQCADLIILSGLFVEVVYLRTLHDRRGIDKIVAAGIEIRHA